ncbi:unnamed protein product [Ilex paraguariensis]|uniref:Uncharacterized protein n=1 Tax=Ilex paraguariensis TaxID=185542 RepID=A0ABC8U7H7_9AQUA
MAASGNPFSPCMVEINEISGDKRDKYSTDWSGGLTILGSTPKPRSYSQSVTQFVGAIADPQAKQYED